MYKHHEIMISKYVKSMPLILWHWLPVSMSNVDTF